MSVIDKLAALVEKLYVESEDYSENPSDVQLWYNRGYANGIVSFLNARGHTDEINHLKLDAEDFVDIVTLQNFYDLIESKMK